VTTLYLSSAERSIHLDSRAANSGGEATKQSFEDKCVPKPELGERAAFAQGFGVPGEFAIGDC
jgi:hypothetical protein